VKLRARYVLALGGHIIFGQVGGGETDETGATVETLTALGLLALDNIEAVLAGRPAPSLVNG
jgi:hypothetical protein